MSNSLIQTGFKDEALFYVNRSLEYGENGFSNYLKAFILYSQEKDMEKLRSRLLTEWKRDTARLDILQEVGKINFMMGAYDSAYHYYNIFVSERERQNLNIYPQEDLKIAAVMQKMGLEERAEDYLKSFLEYAQNDQTIYKDLSLAAYYAYLGNRDMALYHYRLFSNEDNYMYWLVLFESDEFFEAMKDDPEYKALKQTITAKFWKTHDRLRADLEAKGLL